jgi:UDP-glucose 4-epimerase
MWNIGTGVEVSVLDLTRVISQVAGQQLDPVFAPARPGELLRGALAPERAQRDLGWTSATALADGVARVYRWIEAGSPERAGW